ncbi:MAG: ATP-dependent RecD-like DNA helicase [Clostridiales bacterium]|nr:ATP-dependent RecD-like DNA helicase [Clostridiales bacterium]
MEQLSCTVSRITYCDKNSGNMIIRVIAKDYADAVTVLGNMSTVNVGSALIVTGEWKEDEKYGRQFEASEFKEVLPTTPRSIALYLGGGMIKGLSVSLANRLAEAFGKDTLAVIENAPERLTEVSGIGQKRADLIQKGYTESKAAKDIMLFLQGRDISFRLALKIYKECGQNSVEAIMGDPYVLVGFLGFKMADEIALKLGFAKDSPCRVRGGLLHELKQSEKKGNCYAKQGILIGKAASLLEVRTSLPEAIAQLAGERKIFIELPDRIYSIGLYLSEVNVAEKIKEIMASPRKAAGADFSECISKAEKSAGLTYDDEQRDAIELATQSKVSIITGGPGVGKTTIIKGVISVFEQQGLSVLLAAPTGRAAQCLSDATGREAKTIHRHLGIPPKRLSGDALIVDECSMINIELMHSLLACVPERMIVVFVGDVDQLPPIGPGNVLKDFIDSGVIPVVRLNKIYRQAEKSLIIQNAFKIKRGLLPYLNTSDDSADFFFKELDKPAEVARYIGDLCRENLPNYYHIADRVRDIQVLTPMKSGETGTKQLNALLQEALNSKKANSPVLQHYDTEFRIGDKVMQTANNYDKDVFNGDIGIVSSIKENELAVKFNKTTVRYDYGELEELALAYAITIHKSQGSEYPFVVMPLTHQHTLMLKRNLLYTGLTRAKKCFVLVGAKAAIKDAVNDNEAMVRNTMLAQRLKGI